jgi:hypothetical protein
MPAVKKAAAKPAAPDMDDGEIFSLVGRALFPDEENWPSLTGHALDLPKQTVRNIRRGAVNINSTTAAAMLALIERRAAETARARDALKAWMKQHLAGTDTDPANPTK